MVRVGLVKGNNRIENIKKALELIADDKRDLSAKGHPYRRLLYPTKATLAFENHCAKIVLKTTEKDWNR